MLNSLFILTSSGTVLMDKHWRVVISRSIVEQFLDEVRRAGGITEVLPVIKVPKYTLVHVHRDNIIFLAILTAEVAPLLVIEFLHRVADIFKDYFHELSETSLKENFVSAYELLEEIMDNGFPLTTEPNILKEMIPPPSMLNRVVNSVTGGTGSTSKMPQGSMSAIPWRKAGLKYTSNEFYMDIVESIDALIDANGLIVSTEIQGEIQCNCRLSGMPDLTLVFSNPRILDDVSLHPCVRIARWERDRVVSFVPPDGQFKLMSYRVSLANTTQMPLAIRPQINFSGSTGKVDITVRQQNSGGKQVEGVKLVLPLPANTLNVAINVNYGSYEYDVANKVLKWDLNRMPKEKMPALSGNIMLQPGTKAEGNPTVDAEFKINLFGISGLKVDALQMVGEAYKPYKGVRAITKNGKYQIRS